MLMRIQKTLEKVQHYTTNINRLNSGISRTRKHGSRHTASFSGMLNRINASRRARLANSIVKVSHRTKREKKNVLPIAVPVRSFHSLFPESVHK